MVILLRTDLRIRSVLKLATLSLQFGLNPKNGETSGKQMISLKILKKTFPQKQFPHSVAVLELGVACLPRQILPRRPKTEPADARRRSSRLQLLRLLDDLCCEQCHAWIPQHLPRPSSSGSHDHRHLCGKVIHRPALQGLEFGAKIDPLSVGLDLPHYNAHIRARGMFHYVFHQMRFF